MARAQSAPSGEAGGPVDVRVAGSEQYLWVAQLGLARSRLHCRPLTGTFDAGRVIERRVGMMAAAADVVYVFFQDNSLARYTPNSQTPGLNLPGRQRPIHITATADTLYALVDSSVAAALPQPASDEAPRPRDALSLAAYDGNRWQVLADPLPEVRSGDLPRLLAMPGEVLLFSRSADRDVIYCRRWEVERGSWSGAEPIPCEDPTSVWAVCVDAAPVVVAYWSGGGSPRVAAYRRFANDWRRLELRLGDAPGGAPVKSYADAVGAGQRLALVTIDAEGALGLRYAGWQSDALPPPELLSGPLQGDTRNWTPQVRMLVMVMLVGVVASLFLFRRGTVAQPVPLPPGCEPALISQRVAAGLIDFTPFALAGAAATGLDGWAGLGALLRWAFQLDSSRDQLPETSVLVWWGLSVAGFTLYCLVMELLIGRTVGKLLAGYRAISPGRTRATGSATVIRNLCRLIELFPPFWILMFLAVLTRNRQRLGDIYAGTVTVRFRAKASDGARREETATGAGPEENRDDADEG